jgi:hypothetical protein
MIKQGDSRPGKFGGNLKSGGTKSPGRPKGKSKKNALKKLLKDLAAITDTLTDREKMLVYQLYGIVEADIYATSISSSVEHLYFFESDFGIKIGKSKDVQNRLKQIKLYAPEAKVLRVIKYAGKFESNMHKKFSYLNIENKNGIGTEWFRKDKNQIVTFIESIETIECMHKYFNPKGIGQMLMF